MRKFAAVSQIDFLSYALVCGTFFQSRLATKEGLHVVVSGYWIMAIGLLLWALRGNFSLRLGVRLLIVALGMGAIFWLKEPIPNRISPFYMFLVCLILFSPASNRRSALLRNLSGMLAGVSLSALMPPRFGIAFGITLSLLYVGALISLWSGMNLYRSLLWFAKRSIRRETIFLILFLSGIASLGLRQAQNYALRRAEITGLSHVISPGSMKHLVLSSAIAMKVDFGGLIPDKPQEAYFRAAVMDRFLGFHWTQGPSRLRRTVNAEGSDLVYEIAVSPRFSDFAPIMDYGVSLGSRDKSNLTTWGRDNGVFFPFERLESWSYYKATSRVTPTHTLEPEDRERLLELTPGVDARVQDLARDLAGGTSDVNAFRSRLGAFFRDNKFSYTLQADGAISTLADFLFKGRTGYCEHYASATAALARAAGFPARVVAGFLGGEWHGDSQTLIIRDLDAHAWTEIWSDAERSWVRFDPVSLIAPDRIFYGSANYLRSIGADIPDELAMRQRLWTAYFLMELDNLIAILNSGPAVAFAGNIIEYGEELALVGLLGLMVSFLLLRRRRLLTLTSSPEQRIVRQMRNYLARRGMPSLSGETLHDFLRRCAEEWPVAADEFNEFSSVHARYRYGVRASQTDLDQLKLIFRAIKKKMASVGYDSKGGTNDRSA